jgi:hypothetical protein
MLALLIDYSNRVRAQKKSPAAAMAGAGLEFSPERSG